LQRIEKDDGKVFGKDGIEYRNPQEEEEEEEEYCTNFRVDLR